VLVVDVLVVDVLVVDVLVVDVVVVDVVVVDVAMGVSSPLQNVMWLIESLGEVSPVSLLASGL
jgi:hypothetical protein